MLHPRRGANGTIFFAAVTVQTRRAWPAVTVKSKQSPVICQLGARGLDLSPGTPIAFSRSLSLLYPSLLKLRKISYSFLLHSSHEPARRSPQQSSPQSQTAYVLLFVFLSPPFVGAQDGPVATTRNKNVRDSCLLCLKGKERVAGGVSYPPSSRWSPAYVGTSRTAMQYEYKD